MGKGACGGSQNSFAQLTPELKAKGPSQKFAEAYETNNVRLGGGGPTKNRTSGFTTSFRRTWPTRHARILALAHKRSTAHANTHTDVAIKR